MIIALTTARRSKARALEIIKWCADNGFSASDVLMPCRIDTEHRTITLSKISPAEGQEGADFPEARRDDHGLPIAVDLVVPLIVAPPAWLSTEACAA